MATAAEAPAGTMAEGTNQHTQNQADRPANTFGYSREEQFEALRKLREPFPKTEIRHLPRIWCGECKNSRGKGCQRHSFSRCAKCKQNMPSGGHIDLSYVGHAEATNRLLNVDPFWDWEPLTTDERGLPQVDGYKGLWIRLTVCGMTRLGYGHAGDKTGGDAVKEVIGDAIRNAGMRFGMALDLWTSSDLEIIESGGDSGESTETPARQADQRSATPKAAAPQAAADDAADKQLKRLMGQAQRCWANRIALEQVKADAEKNGVLDNQVQGPPPEGRWMAFRELLDIRITFLKQQAAAEGVDTERGAA